MWERRRPVCDRIKAYKTLKKYNLQKTKPIEYRLNLLLVTSCCCTRQCSDYRLPLCRRRVDHESERHGEGANTHPVQHIACVVSRAHDRGIAGRQPWE